MLRLSYGDIQTLGSTLVFIFCGLALICGCGTPETRNSGQPASTGLTDLPTLDAVTQQLRDQIGQDIQKANQGTTQEQQVVRQLGNTFYKSFVVYPDDQKYNIEVIKTESLLQPYKARVVIPQKLFTTNYHYIPAQAENDTDFFVDYGELDSVYQYRQGSWKRQRSVFVSDERRYFTGGNEGAVPEAKSIPQVQSEERLNWLGKIVNFFSF